MDTVDIVCFLGGISMGYMTPIMLLNDSKENIVKHPDQVVQNILDAMDDYKIETREYSIGNFSNPMKSCRPVHSSSMGLYVAHHNGFFELGQFNTVKDIAYRKEILRRAKEILLEEEELIRKIENEQ